MNEIELKLNGEKRGAFVIDQGDNRLAEMAIAISNGNLIVYHTHVADELQGKGVASALLAKMVEYARNNKLKVVALCPYVRAQFTRSPEKYNDVWNRNWKDQ